MNPTELTIHELTEAYARRDLSPVEAVRAYLDRIETVNPLINAYITATPEQALKQAVAAEDRIAKGEGGPLTGVPLALKDVLCTQGTRTSCASGILKNFIPPYDAFLVARLREAGAGLPGQDQHGRIRHGVVQRTLGLWSNPESLGSRTDPRRFQRRIGGRPRPPGFARAPSAPIPEDRFGNRPVIAA